MALTYSGPAECCTVISETGTERAGLLRSWPNRVALNPPGISTIICLSHFYPQEQTVFFQYLLQKDKHLKQTTKLSAVPPKHFADCRYLCICTTCFSLRGQTMRKISVQQCQLYLLGLQSDIIVIKVVINLYKNRKQNMKFFLWGLGFTLIISADLLLLELELAEL